MARLFRLLAGLLLLPVCVVMTQTLLALVAAAHPDSAAILPLPGLALAAGYLLWLLIFYTLPRPTRTYVLAHELTHALWAALMGARVSRLSVSKRGGSVTVSRTNVLITLAPYFFPLYTMIVIAGYYVLGIWQDVARVHLLWLGLVGFTWGFHFTFTIATLLQHQSDIRMYGRTFSYALIYLFNVLGICLWTVLVSAVRWGAAWDFFAFYLREMAALLGRAVVRGYTLVLQ